MNKKIIQALKEFDRICHKTSSTQLYAEIDTDQMFYLLEKYIKNDKKLIEKFKHKYFSWLYNSKISVSSTTPDIKKECCENYILKYILFCNKIV